MAMQAQLLQLCNVPLQKRTGMNTLASLNEAVTLTAIVTGRVQGVGFRQFAQAQARQLRLVGWARNLADGSVEVVAHGPRPAVDALRAKLLVGPRFAYVANISEDWTPRDEIPDRFEIRA